MDILYVVGTGSHWENNELRYSLRSIAKNARNVGRVFIVGHKPDFVSDIVTHIPYEDTKNRKHKNIMLKVAYAAEHSDIAPHFLISSDDHFYVREVDFDNYPVYYQDKVIAPHPTAEQLKNNYYKSLVQTRELLTKWGLPHFQTNPHCNTHFDTELYRRFYPLFTEAVNLEYGGEVNCIMGNLLAEQGIQPKQFIDKKISEFDTIADLEQQIGQTECFSIGDNAIKCGVDAYLQQLFPYKCIYEK